ncbi:hypothetical protein GM182_07395 [bacterium 3DAC]|nr:hypothetical protein GM182_07395 [bacterium 3DAC]
MDKQTPCDIIKMGIEARKQYIQGWYWLAGGVFASILGLLLPPLLVLAIILVIIGLVITAIAFLSHLDVLKRIRLETPYDPHTPVLLAIALQIATGLISLIVIISAGDFQHPPITANLFSAIANLIIFITLYRQMYIQIEKALNISLDIAYNLGVFESIFVSIKMLISEPAAGLVIGFFILAAMYFQLSEFLGAYKDAWKNQCNDETAPPPQNTYNTNRTP